MGDARKDPSMEEILASIKRVIAQDNRIGGGAAATATAPIAEATSPAEDDVLELDDPVTESDGLMSPDAAAASRERLQSLSAMRQRAEAPPQAGALEAAVREMLRPMLKEWLDENLPGIVETLVTREIARITGRSI
jgi:cell pole-organizing protein PopZ